jgi:NitT/TauT family transport system substrate-binding protein
MNIQRLVAVVLLSVLVLIGWFFARSATDEPLHTSVAVARTPLSAPVFVAHDMGFFEKHHLDVTLLEVNGGHRSFRHMLDGSAQYAVSSEFVVTLGFFARQDFTVLTSLAVSSNDIKVVALKSSGIASFDDLAGKRIAYTKGSAGEYFLSSLLALQNIPASAVILVDTQPEEMLSVLKRRDVDVAVAWEPYVYEVLEALPETIITLPTQNLYELSFLLTALNTNARNTEVTQRLLLALADAVDFINQQPLEAKRLVKERLALDDRFIDWLWDDYIFKLSLGQSLLITAENEAHWARSQNLVQSKDPLQVDKFFDSSALDQALEAKVNH